MPKRTEDTYGVHHGKHKYISKNYQRNWNITEDGLEVKTDVEIDTGEKIVVETKVESITKEELPKEIKEKRRKLIKKHHPDKNPDDPKSSDKLKKILKDFDVNDD